MRRIVVMNTKGGCGKTTIATNLASYYARQGHVTALFDYDAQHSSSHWLKLRNGNAAPIHGVTAYERTPLTMTRSWQLRVPPETDRIVVDTPASIDRQDFLDHVRQVDAILIPVLPSPIDTSAAADFVRDLFLIGKVRGDRVQVGIISNRVRANTRAFQALTRFLGSLDIPVVAQLRDSQGYVHATDQGCGIHELNDSRAARERHHWRRVYRWLEEGRSGLSPTPRPL
ncbi:ParA family protein [Sediminicurvatus halobius]|uniref:CobQ/CobB/MinD/ParA nucleotide binding domain-containing protein n=1 Tax=Sediminicurvatus halobius TaxID=2182432 RepID=A0A2U2MXK6_9GAMM|nr:ParA family protein [Spiribacter halobius]PWG61665.1 hypothetical protein DEM34_15435 [Spiribacter halobius]UEX79436.1 ParA family protein [Spiribacter halobius]